MTSKDTKAFAARVCDWSIGPHNKRIKGTYHVGGHHLKPFEITGERARTLIDFLIKAEDH